MRTLCVAAALFAATATPASAQVVDTTAADTTLQQSVDTTAADTTLQQPADTTAVTAADTTEVIADTLAAGADTTAAIADTTAAPSDSTAHRAPSPPVGFADVFAGEALSDSLPALLPAVDLVDLLADEAGSFAYLFNTPGWPEGWSFHGLPPDAPTLTFNRLPFSHLFTGSPAYQLVPLALIEQPRLERLQFGRAVHVSTGLRPFASAVPTTEAKYWKGGAGLQSIEAVHAQHRRREMFGNPGFLNVLGAYTGRASDGEYPGSRLRRARQVLLRLRYEQPTWAVELFNLHNRRGIGAQGGVIPEAGDPESIYIRPGAAVVNPEARRRIVRNDLAATLRMRLLGGASTATAFWTAETFRYTLPADTVGTESDRFGFRFSQPLLQTNAHRLAVNLTGWMDRISPMGQFDHPVITERALHASVMDTLRAGGWRSKLEAGIAAFGGGVKPVGAIDVSRRLGVLEISAGLSASNRPLPAAATSGFGSLEGLPTAPAEQILLGSVAIGIETGVIDVAIGGFASRRSDPTDYFDLVGWPDETTPDSVVVATVADPIEVFGAFADVGWRRDAERGLYATLRPTLHYFPASDDPLTQLIAETLPASAGRARLGARFVIFQGDLDVDAYLEAVAWSSMRSRILHPETGLLAVPPASAPFVGPSSMLNVVVEAGVRDATLFLVYENALAGTQLMTGNLIVPVYPLPERRFRFGVFWPIFG